MSEIIAISMTNQNTPHTGLYKTRVGELLSLHLTYWLILSILVYGSRMSLRMQIHTHTHTKGGYFPWYCGKMKGNSSKCHSLHFCMFVTRTSSVFCAWQSLTKLPLKCLFFVLFENKAENGVTQMDIFLWCIKQWKGREIFNGFIWIFFKFLCEIKINHPPPLSGPEVIKEVFEQKKLTQVL